jgi:TetR/AcrR family transcriptional repressor of nem operon
MSRPLNKSTREKILESAYLLFYKKGCRATSMDDVAQSAGIKKANLFHYYKTKDELVLAVVESAVSCLKERLRKQLAGETGQDPVKTIKTLFQESSKRMKKSFCCGGCFIGNISQELSDHNEEIRRQVAGYLKFWQKELEAFFERAKQKKQFSSGLSSQLAAHSVVTIMEGTMILCKAHKQTKTFELSSRFVVEYLQNYQK